MNDKINDGGAAFPTMPPVGDTGRAAVGYPYPESGMTLRDHFAGEVVAAMVSTIRNDADYNRACEIAEAHGMEKVSDWFAHDSYKQADAMLRVRERTKASHDPRSKSKDAEEVAQWLYANGYHEAASTILTQLDIRNNMIAEAKKREAQS